MGPTRFLLLRLEAPLMAFGGPVVDANGRTRPFPGQAQITGLLGNALGYRHRDAEALAALQRRLRMAAALIESGELVRDYQTVDLGQTHLAGTGWTTRGTVEARGGASGEATHIRLRWYLADALVLVALMLDPPGEDPSLADLEAALTHPARPLFIGRKPCLPTAPIFLAPSAASDALGALRDGMKQLADRHPTLRRRDTAPGKIQVELDTRLAAAIAANGMNTEYEQLVDRRDWHNQMHTGERAVRRVRVDAPWEDSA